MADDFKKVTPGATWAPPSAATHNAFVDAAVFAKNQRHSGGGPLSGGAINGTLVTVRNDTGSDLEQFAPVILDDLLITPDNNEGAFKGRGPVFSVVATTAQTTCKPFAIMSQPVKDAKFANAMISGVSPLKINIISEDHDYAELHETDGARSASSGPLRILWKASETGPAKWALAQFPAGGSGSGGAVPCKITGANGDDYNVELHANGRELPATGTGVLQIQQIHIAETIAAGDWVIGFPSATFAVNQE